MTDAQGRPRAKNGERAGTQALRLLSTPLYVHILRALAAGPRPLGDLRREADLPPQTTMRGHLRTLTETGVLVRQRRDAFPGSVDVELTAAGRELWDVAGVLAAWLRAAPEGPLPLGSSAAKSAVRAMVEGWATSIVRALAARPLSLTELNGLITGLSYPSLERRLVAMRMAGQIERTPVPGRGNPYRVTAWLRSAIAPLGAATRWERTHVPDRSAPVRRLDAEAALLLTVPVLRLSEELTGSCRLAVEIGGGTDGDRLAGVLVGVEEGRIVSCVAGVKGNADAWASGSASGWLQAVIEEDTRKLEVGGACQIAEELLAGLHRQLFGALQRD